MHKKLSYDFTKLKDKHSALIAYCGTFPDNEINRPHIGRRGRHDIDGENDGRRQHEGAGDGANLSLDVPGNDFEFDTEQPDQPGVAANNNFKHVFAPRQGRVLPGTPVCAISIPAAC